MRIWVNSFLYVPVTTTTHLLNLSIQPSLGLHSTYCEDLIQFNKVTSDILLGEELLDDSWIFVLLRVELMDDGWHCILIEVEPLHDIRNCVLLEKELLDDNCASVLLKVELLEDI